MGQDQSRPEHGLTSTQVSKVFAQKCAKQFSSIELLELKEMFKEFADEEAEGGVQYWRQVTLIRQLDIPDELLDIGSLIHKSVGFLGAFPFVGQQPKTLTIEALVKAVAFYNGKYKKVLGDKFEIDKLLFMSFANVEDELELDRDKLYAVTEHWNEMEVVEKLMQVENMFISGHDLYLLFTFLLVFASYKPFDDMEQHVQSLDTKLLIKYKNSALCMVRTLYPDVSSVSSLDGIKVTWKEFESGLRAAYSQVFNSLGNVFDQLLFNKTKVVTEKVPITESKLTNPSVISQLETIFGQDEKIDFANMVRLYAGSDAGFSMRSFETKVFKWDAPTILLVSGKTTTPNSSKPATLRQKSFDEMIPPAKVINHTDSMNSVSSLQSDASYPKPKHRVVFAVYVEAAWKASSKECFGDNKTTLIQLAPVQDVYKPSFHANNYAYYTRSHPGPGGIGFGSAPPKMLNGQATFVLGNVSLTIEESLEFATFQHLGPGGSFHLSEIHPELEFEERFSIDEIEVWGCGNDEVLAKQKEQWAWEEREAAYRQTVNLRTGNHAEERSLLEMAGLVGHNQSGGSV